MAKAPARAAGGRRSRREPLRVPWRRAQRVPRPLAALLIVGALLAVGWDVALPAFQGPDEDSHFAYVQHLAETGETPSATTGNSPISTEQHDVMTFLNLFPLRGVLGGRPAWSPADLRAWRAIERTLPSSARADGSGPNAVGHNPPLYYALMSVPYNIFSWLPALKLIFVLRLFNALCYLATITLVWLIAGELFGAVRWKQTIAAGAVALQPQVAFMSAVINADNLLIALTTAFLLAALRLVRRGPSLRRVVIASLLAAAASLTHGRGLVTLPVLAVAILAAWIRFRPPRAQLARQLGGAVAATGGAALLYMLFGTPSGGGGAYGGQVHELNSSAPFNFKQFLSSIYQFYLPRLAGMHPRLGPEYGYRQVFIETFYGAFGWLEVRFHPRLYDLLQVLSALGLVGLYSACLTRWRRLWAQWPSVVVMLALLVTTLVFLHYVSYHSLLTSGGAEPLIVGRYLLPMIALFGLAIAFVAGALPRRAGPFLAAVVLAMGALLSLAAIGLTAARFYA